MLVHRLRIRLKQYLFYFYRFRYKENKNYWGRTFNKKRYADYFRLSRKENYLTEKENLIDDLNSRLNLTKQALEAVLVSTSWRLTSPLRTIKKIGLFLWQQGDIKTIDRFGPDGLSKLIKYFSTLAVRFQNGFIYHYAFVMLLGFSALLTFLILK